MPPIPPKLSNWTPSAVSFVTRCISVEDAFASFSNIFTFSLDNVLEMISLSTAPRLNLSSTSASPYATLLGSFASFSKNRSRITLCFVISCSDRTSWQRSTSSWSPCIPVPPMSFIAITLFFSCVTSCPCARNSSFVGIGPPTRIPFNFLLSQKCFFMCSATRLKNSFAALSRIRANLCADCPPARVFPGMPDVMFCNSLMCFPSRIPIDASFRSIISSP